MSTLSFFFVYYKQLLSNLFDPTKASPYLFHFVISTILPELIGRTFGKIHLSCWTLSTFPCIPLKPPSRLPYS
jgi:hypothetical protein